MEKKPKVNLLDNGFTEIDGYIYTDKGSLIGKRNPDKLNITVPDTQKESIGNFTDRGMIDRTPIQSEASQSQAEALSPESGISTPPEQKEAVQQPVTFDQSFAQARQQGLSEFEFQGKRFNTKLKQDTPTEQPVEEPQEQPDITSDVTGKEGLEKPGTLDTLNQKVQNFSQVMEIVDSVGQRNPDIDLEDSEAVLGAMTEQEQALWQAMYDHASPQEQPQQEGRTGQAIGTTVKAAAGMTALYTAGKMYKNYKKRGGVFNFKDPNAAPKTTTATTPDAPQTRTYRQRTPDIEYPQFTNEELRQVSDYRDSRSPLASDVINEQKAAQRARVEQATQTSPADAGRTRPVHQAQALPLKASARQSQRQIIKKGQRILTRKAGGPIGLLMLPMDIYDGYQIGTALRDVSRENRQVYEEKLENTREQIRELEPQEINELQSVYKELLEEAKENLPRSSGVVGGVRSKEEMDIRKEIEAIEFMLERISEVQKPTTRRYIRSRQQNVDWM